MVWPRQGLVDDGEEKSKFRPFLNGVNIAGHQPSGVDGRCDSKLPNDWESSENHFRVSHFDRVFKFEIIHDRNRISLHFDGWIIGVSCPEQENFLAVAHRDESILIEQIHSVRYLPLGDNGDVVFFVEKEGDFG